MKNRTLLPTERTPEADTRRVGATTRRVGFTTRRVEISTRRVEKNSPGLFFDEYGEVEKGADSEGKSLPWAIIKVHIVSLIGKSGISISTFRERFKAGEFGTDGLKIAEFSFAGTRLALHLQQADAQRTTSGVASV